MSEPQETSLYFKPDREYLISDLALDLILSEEEKLSGRATSSPVEEGADISDSIELDPLVLTMTGFITNTPVRDVDDGDTSNRYRDAIHALKEIRLAKLPVTIVATEEVYENMAIEELSIPRNVSLGESAEISLSFRQIVIVKSQTAVMPVSVIEDKQALGNADMGQAGESGSDALGDEETQKSLYEKAMEALQNENDSLDKRLVEYG
ncbi:MAG: hypothetical protein PQJ58_17180 [Spirochaetales bacterium]|nr:hypothetical protein [Spirochaetales bacterium]